MTGRGCVKLRSKLHTEERARGLESIVVTEIPYALNKANLIQKIAALINDRKIEGISDLRDESDRTGIRIVIDLKKGAISDVIVNSLYKYTALETSIGMNFLAVVKNRPKLLNLKEYLELFIEHRQEVVLRRSRFELKKAEHRAHILEGLRIALDNIDEVVAIIRGSSHPAEAKEKLMQRFELSDVQSQAILDMRLQRLTNMEQSKIQEEYQELLKQIEFLKSIINSAEVLRGVIRDELVEIKKTYASPRRTQLLSDDPSQIDMEDLIADQEVVITLSRKGYIKRTPVSSYNQQKRGGKGMSGSSLGDSDYVQALLTSSNHQNLLLFTSLGRVFRLKVYQIPEGSRRAKGAHISNLIDMQKNEYVATALSQRDLNLNNYFVFISKRGMIKRSEVELYKNLRANGLIALSLRKGDELMAVREVAEHDELMLLTRLGFAIRFPCADIRPTGRQASGVKGISLRDQDEVVSGLVIGQDMGAEVLTVTEHGFGKRTPLDHYRIQARGGKGIINLKPTAKTGSVLGGMMVSEQDQVLILTSENKMIRFAVSDVRTCGRAAQGVKLVSMDNGGTVVCFDRILPENGEEDRGQMTEEK
jgi:DNA gyrase subunit A